jgi:hypothetical protein
MTDSERLGENGNAEGRVGASELNVRKRIALPDASPRCILPFQAAPLQDAEIPELP